MKIALVSLDQSWEDKLANQAKVLQILERISNTVQVNLVIFPEMTLTSFTMNTIQMAEKLESSQTIEFFCACAKKHKVHIIFGFILANGEKAGNNLIVISPLGQVMARYQKIHPFSYAGEDQYYSAGDKIVTVDIGGICMGLTICYDLRFPEIYQALSKQAEVIINIANWPAKRVTHWNVLLQARAIENQVFMLGVNRTGQDAKGINYEYSTKAINPNGDILKPELQKDSLDIYDLDFAEVAKIRSSFPVKNDRKIKFYKEVL